jgi:hypothetical protein
MTTGFNGMRVGLRETAMSRFLVSVLRCDLPLIIFSVTLAAVQSG